MRYVIISHPQLRLIGLVANNGHYEYCRWYEKIDDIPKTLAQFKVEAKEKLKGLPNVTVV